MKEEEKKQSHNMTVTEMEELKYKQQNGIVETVKANKDSSYEIPEHEQHLIHAEIEIKQFDTASGAKTSIEKVQTFYPKEFADMVSSGGFKGYSVKVIHDPKLESEKVEKPSKAKAGKVESEKVEKPLTKKEQKELDSVRAEYKTLYGEADETLSLEEMQELIDLKKSESK